jgi:hypothetical protein
MFGGKWGIFIYFSKKAHEIKLRSLPEGNKDIILQLSLQWILIVNYNFRVWDQFQDCTPSSVVTGNTVGLSQP